MSTPPDRDATTLVLVALSLVPGLGPATMRRLLGTYASPAELLDAPLTLAADRRDKSALSKIAEVRDTVSTQAEDQIKRAAEHGVEIVTYLDDVYPMNLVEAIDAPPVLYIKGRIQSRDHLSVAVVGSRDASVTGIGRARKLAELLAQRGITVVSGLARGIDTAAHRAAIDAHGRTIAVVGCGLDRTYPTENTPLAAEIAEHGAIISQFPIGTPPHARNFPMRNKTMALLSLATVVVEASSVSGAKMQADFALKTETPRRSVFLMKSLIDAQGADGWPRQFLQRGAQRMEYIEDLLNTLPIPAPSRAGQQLALFR